MFIYQVIINQDLQREKDQLGEQIKITIKLISSLER